MADEQGAKKKPPMKTIVTVLVMLLAEAVGVVVVMKMWGGPGEVQGTEINLEEEANLNRPVEILVLQDRIPNQSTGRIWLYDTEVYAVVKNRHAESVTEELERRRAEVHTEIAQIWRRATQSDFKEPGLERLTSRTYEYLTRLIGSDDAGEPKIEKVLIPKCNGFRADF
jgi:flagellar basal body-associated protein FliL